MVISWRIGSTIFNVGDEVITDVGEKGTIVDICECESCKERGFCEPVWEDADGEWLWITDYEAEHGFRSFYKIGNYIFGNLRKTPVLERIRIYERRLDCLRGQLALIEELEKEETC